MSIDQDLQQLALQEARLRFPAFDANTAWTVGTALRAAAEAHGVGVSIDVTLNGHQLFFFAMPGTTPDNIEWIRRKRNVVQRFHRSSYAVGLDLKKQQTTLTEKLGLPLQDYAPHGGCFPIRLANTGCIGTIAVSGLPQRSDHALIVEVLAGLLDQPLEELALAPETA